MRFGVLGPLAAWTADGAPVDIPERKVRALLAVLLVTPGRPVSVDRLVDDVWGDRPPRDPVATVQAKVSLLRRVLDDAEAGARRLIVRRPPGYLLDVDTDAVDALRFAALMRRALSADDPRTRAAVLAEALKLWRGEAFADFADAAFATAAISRLTEERLAAAEDHAHARLDLGEHEPLVAELGDLVRRHPRRQRLRAAHLRALHLAGRQDEALDGYHDLRVRLAEELGIDPDRALTELYQAILRQDPKLHAAPRPRRDLPSPPPELFGRDSDLAEVLKRIESHRLTTVTGPAGVGKTSLAATVAAELADGYDCGLWWVELSGLDHDADVTALAAEVLSALDIHEGGAIRQMPTGGPAPPVERLLGAMRGGRMLLVWDNCEHVIEAAGELAATLLRGVPGLRILATSREPLYLTEEVLWPLAPLAVPDPGGSRRPTSATRLFSERVAATVPGFEVTDANAAAVAAICRRLDGIPLAIELAAARVRALGVTELRRRLDEGFSVLSSGRRTAPDRQRTLRAAIDWSWRLLDESERAVLRRLAVHADGCALNAAERVCAGDDLTAESVVDVLARLVDRSLVVMTDTPLGPRYRLLDSIAAYGAQRLAESGEADSVRTAYLRYYTELAETAEPKLYGGEQRRWLRLLDAETANMRAALGQAVRGGDADTSLRLANALTWYWFLRGRLTTARDGLAAAMAVPGGDASARARAAAWHRGMTLRLDDRSGMNRDLPDEELWSAVADPVARIRAAWFLGLTPSEAGDRAYRTVLVEQILADARRHGDRWGEAVVLCSRAGYRLGTGDLAGFQRDGERSAALFGELGDRWGELQAVYPRAYRAEITGDYPLAERLNEDGLRIAEELGLRLEYCERLAGLGRVALLVGDYRRAGRLHEQAVECAVEQQFKPGEITARIGLGMAARRGGDLDTAVEQFTAVLDWNRTAHFRPVSTLMFAELGFVAELRGDAARATELQRSGWADAVALDDPRAIALAAEGMAGAVGLAGEHERAARLLGAAAALRDSVGAPLPDGERADVDRIVARTREALGHRQFADEYASGGRVRPDQAMP